MTFLDSGHYMHSNGHYWKIIHHRKSGRLMQVPQRWEEPCHNSNINHLPTKLRYVRQSLVNTTAELCVYMRACVHPLPVRPTFLRQVWQRFRLVGVFSSPSSAAGAEPSEAERGTFILLSILMTKWWQGFIDQESSVTCICRDGGESRKVVMFFGPRETSERFREQYEVNKGGVSWQTSSVSELTPRSAAVGLCRGCTAL